MSQGGQREPGGSQRGGNEAQKRPKGRGNEIQEGLRGKPKGGRRVTNGAGRAPIVSRRTPKGSKRGARGPQRGAGGPRSVRRVAKGACIVEFDDCYTVS